MSSKLTRRIATAGISAAAAGALFVPSTAADDLVSDLSSKYAGSLIEFWWNFAWIPAYFSSVFHVNEILTSLGF
ncbi:hypothetical protein [Corynebacterium freiburgense]|uniref:hypothetical protein n=1 Tax=Corynebacterium freiburgense TaxID=556548 RepID=UPI00040C3CDC|nr:hypothetical protein [Corynebacterium freiburgense]WJZ01848.1 hypothetical protein CFREI_02720 [Corynebacterium freiburgense]